MNRLKARYQKEVVPALKKEFGYTNVMAIPKVEKVVINLGLGSMGSGIGSAIGLALGYRTGFVTQALAA